MIKNFVASIFMDFVVTPMCKLYIARNSFTRHLHSCVEDRNLKIIIKTLEFLVFKMFNIVYKNRLR